MNSDYGNLPTEPMQYLLSNLDGHGGHAHIILAIAEDMTIKNEVIKEVKRHLKDKYAFILFFDAFDAMVSPVWEVTKSDFTELLRAGEGRAKVVITCRTRYFRERKDQGRGIGEKGAFLSGTETELYRELRRGGKSEVVYLQAFDNEVGG